MRSTQKANAGEDGGILQGTDVDGSLRD